LSTVYQFPAGSGAWVENIAERANGQLLITRMFTPELWLIDPSSGSAQLLYSFPGANSVTGITPTGNADEFAVAVGNVDAATFTPEAGSWSTWKVSLKGTKATASLITKLPEAKFLNGMGFFHSGKAKGLLITDSVVGGIWAIDLATGASSLALQDDAMLAPAGATFAVGIDGFRIKGNSLYYTVFAGGVLRRLDVEFPTAAALAAGTATLKQVAVTLQLMAPSTSPPTPRTLSSRSPLPAVGLPSSLVTLALLISPAPRLHFCPRSTTFSTSQHLVVLPHPSTALSLRLARS
jgi:hypothetical protein